MPALAASTVVGLSGLHVVYKHLHLPAGNASTSDLPAAVASECDRDYAALQALYGNEQHVHLYCFRGLLTLRLLEELQVDPARLLVDDGGTAWSAGAALYWLAGLGHRRAWLPGAPPRCASSRSCWVYVECCQADSWERECRHVSARIDARLSPRGNG